MIASSIGGGTAGEMQRHGGRHAALRDFLARAGLAADGGRTPRRSCASDSARLGSRTAREIDPQTDCVGDTETSARMFGWNSHPV